MGTRDRDFVTDFADGYNARQDVSLSKVPSKSLARPSEIEFEAVTGGDDLDRITPGSATHELLSAYLVLGT